MRRDVFNFLQATVRIVRKYFPTVSMPSASSHLHEDGSVHIKGTHEIVRTFGRVTILLETRRSS